MRLLLNSARQDFEVEETRAPEVGEATRLYVVVWATWLKGFAIKLVEGFSKCSKASKQSPSELSLALEVVSYSNVLKEELADELVEDSGIEIESRVEFGVVAGSDFGVSHNDFKGLKTIPATLVSRARQSLEPQIGNV